MCVRWVILVYILKIHLKAITSQYHNHHYYEPASQYDDVEDRDEYEEAPEFFNRRRAKYRKLEKVNESDECLCSCEECINVNLRECCTQFCKYCRTSDTPSSRLAQYHTLNEYPDQLQQNQEQKVVFVPFPYPLIVPNAVKNHNAANSADHETLRPEQQKDETDVTKYTQTEPTTTTKATITTTTKATTTTTTPAPTTAKALTTSNEVLRAKSVEVSMMSRHRKMKQLNPAVKRDKPAWVPKYGIVPIPDHLAAKLMTQLTEVRALKARKM